MLEALNVTYRVAERELISGVSLELEPGQLHLIVGPNGAGKSTLVKVFAGYLKPHSGSIRYDDLDIATVKGLELAKRRAVLSQAVEVTFPLKVSEVVMMGRYPHFGGSPGPVDEQVVREMMDYFQVTEFANRDYLTLSGGERQRVNFARILSQLWTAKATEDQRSDVPSPLSRFLFLDEPLTFLDIRHQIDFMRKVKVFAESSDVVCVGVVHDLNLAAQFGDQIIMVDKGKVIAQGAPYEILTRSNLQNIFEIDAKFVEVEGAGIQMVFE